MLNPSQQLDNPTARTPLTKKNSHRAVQGLLTLNHTVDFYFLPDRVSQGASLRWDQSRRNTVEGPQQLSISVKSGSEELPG